MKRIVPIGLLVLAVAVIIVGGMGWYYASQIIGPDTPPEFSGQTVLGHSDSTITLTPTRKAARPGRWAIEWPGGYGEMGAIVARDSSSLTRRFRLASGTPPDTSAKLAGFAWESNPETWLGVPFEEVQVPSRVGPLPAWKIAGADSTWAIFVHGRAVTRAETLRMLPGYLVLGLPCLVISYRNDHGAPRIAEGGYRMGATEWQDVEDAVRFALAHGARDVAVVGCSMGGGIVVQFLRHSALRGAARVAVLDAPALDWDAVLAVAAAERGVPPPVTALGMQISTMRAGIDWHDLVQVLHARDFSTPMLIFHGDDDHTVPFAVSQRFAAARPDLVTLVRVPGADHVESSNYESGRYELTLVHWLVAHGVGGHGR